MNVFRTRKSVDEETIEAMAAAWLAQRDEGLTPEEQTEFARWQQADARHAAVVARLEKTWRVLQQLREFRPEARVHPDRDLLARPGGRRVVPFPALAATATLAAALALMAAWWWPQRAPAVATLQSPTAYATTAGGYQRVALEDGSVLELNSNSAVRVQFTAAERTVRLVQGEVHFTVAQNKARPFLVQAGTVVVRAVGTAFNVRLGASGIEVLVTEGKVAVAEVERVVPNALSGVTEPDQGRWGQRTSPSPALVAANERLLIPTVRANDPVASIATPVVERISPEAVREALAWQGARLIFVETPLADVVGQFNRRNPVQLVLGDASLGALPVGGSFRAENVEAFVRLLTSGGDIVAERPEANRIILRRGFAPSGPDALRGRRPQEPD